jgi:chromosome segregation ATPase
MVMSMFNKKDHQQIIDEARETIERLKDEQPPTPDVQFKDPIQEWKRSSDVIAAAREAAQAEMSRSSQRTRAAPIDWSAIDARIEQVLTAECQKIAEAFAQEFIQLLDEERKGIKQDLRDAVHALELQAAELNTKLAELRATFAEQRSQIIDLPSSPLARRN